LEPARDGGVIVDGNAMHVVLCKEHALVISNGTGKLRVRNCGVGESGEVKAGYIEPMTGETEATLRLETGVTPLDDCTEQVYQLLLGEAAVVHGKRVGRT